MLQIFSLIFGPFKICIFGLKQLSDAASADTSSRCLKQYFFSYLYGQKSRLQAFKWTIGYDCVLNTSKIMTQTKLKISRSSQFLRIFTVFYLLTDFPMQTSSLWSLTDTIVLKILLKFLFWQNSETQEM